MADRIEWTEYKCKSGETLFIHKKDAEEHKKPSESYTEENCAVILYKELCSTGTQTDDDGCINGCTSMYVNTNSVSLSRQELSVDKLRDYSGAIHVVGKGLNDGNEEERNSAVEGNTLLEDVEGMCQGTSGVGNEKTVDSSSDKDKELNEDGIYVHVPIAQDGLENNNEFQTPESLNVYCDGVQTKQESNVGNHLNHSCSESTYQGVANGSGFEMLFENELNPEAKRTSNEEKPFECSYCKKRFSYKCNLIVHQRIHTKEKPFECSICEKKFSQNKSLIIHQRLHTGEKPFECSYCNKKFAYDHSLKYHLTTHTGLKKFECSFCKKRFARNIYLKSHLRTHTGEKPFDCSHCGKAFSQRGSLYNHMNIHNREISLQCLYPENVNQDENVPALQPMVSLKEEQTQRACPKASPFECSLCKVTFTQKKSLIIHQRTHTGEKPFECSYCKKSFAYDHSLKGHLTMHTGDKKFECPFCQKRFARNIYLKNHLRTHTGEKPYGCVDCGKKFSQRGNLTCHMKKHN